jgi:DNA primase
LKFNQDFIEQVRDANNVVDIIGQYTELKGRGHQFMGLCPFPDHTEKSPSFSVSDSKQVYHCFGCKKSGNVYTFLQEHSGLSFTDAVEFLARRANIPLPETFEENKDKTNKSTFFRINKFAANVFHHQLKSLPETHIVKKYLVQRGLDDATVDEMKLGYAGDNWSDLYEVFRERKVPIDEAERLGLIKPKNKQNGYFDLFHHRLMFPIFSTQEDVVGFGGRVLDKEQKPKYLNSPESAVFHKGRTFYGLNLAAKNIRQHDRVVIVEGYMDQIALYSAGIKNVVATLGTALTEDHARLIQKYTTQVVLMFDGDFAGMTAAERSMVPMFAQGLCPLAVFLPESLDPDDYVKKYGAEDLQNKINQAQELFIQMINAWLKDSKFTANEKLVFMEKVAPYLNAISDRSLKSLYIKEVATRLSVEEKWVVRALQDEAPKSAIVKPTAEKPPVPVEDPNEPLQWRIKGAPKEELYLLGVVLNSPESLAKVIEVGAGPKFSSDSVKKLLSLVIERYRQNPSDFDKLAPLVVSRIKDPEELTGLFKFWSLDGAEDEVMKTTLSCIKRVEARYLKAQSQIIAGQLQNGVEGTSLEKLEQIMNIHKNRIQLNRPIKGEP